VEKGCPQWSLSVACHEEKLLLFLFSSVWGKKADIFDCKYRKTPWKTLSSKNCSIYL